MVKAVELVAPEECAASFCKYGHAPERLGAEEQFKGVPRGRGDEVPLVLHLPAHPLISTGRLWSNGCTCVCMRVQVHARV